MDTLTTLTHLECSLCSKTFEAGKVYNLCACGGPEEGKRQPERHQEAVKSHGIRVS